MDQFMRDIVVFIKDVGFPIFVAVFLLLRIGPDIRHLDRSILLLVRMMGKTNGFKEEDVENMIEEVMSKKRRYSDDTKGRS